MTEDQREAWRKAIADRSRQQRTQRGKPRRRAETVTGPGMVRVPVARQLARRRRGDR